MVTVGVSNSSTPFLFREKGLCLAELQFYRHVLFTRRPSCNQRSRVSENIRPR